MNNWNDCSYEQPPWGFGSTYSINSDSPPYDCIAALHKVVEEVTRKPVVVPPKKIGFY